MTINLKTGEKKRFNVLLFGVLAFCFQTNSGKTFCQTPWHETGQNYGIVYDIKQSVFVSNSEDVEWPDEAFTYSPANPPLKPTGDTPVSRQKVTATNNNSFRMKVTLRIVCRVQQNSGGGFVEVFDVPFSRNLNPNETAIWGFDFDQYTPPAMPDAPNAIRYDLTLERDDPFMPNIVRRDPWKVLHRHH